MTTTASAAGERFLHILNLDGFDKAIHLAENGEPLLEGRTLILPSREGLLLPLNVAFGDVRIVYSTAEIAWVAEDAIEFRLTQPQDVIALDTRREIAPSQDYDVELRSGTTLVSSRKHTAVDDRLTVSWK